MTAEQKKPEQQNNETQFLVQRLYIKDLSYETPNNSTPDVFKQKWEPELTLDINTTSNVLETDVYEVILTVTATVKNQNSVAFLVEVKQAGIFTIQSAPEDQLDHLLNSFCPSMLFPYAREAITSQVIHGSFPQLVLAPINFDALYMQQIAEKKKGTHAKEEVTTH